MDADISGVVGLLIFMTLLAGLGIGVIAGFILRSYLR